MSFFSFFLIVQKEGCSKGNKRIFQHKKTCGICWACRTLLSGHEAKTYAGARDRQTLTWNKRTNITCSYKWSLWKCLQKTSCSSLAYHLPQLGFHLGRNFLRICPQNCSRFIDWLNMYSWARHPSRYSQTPDVLAFTDLMSYHWIPKRDVSQNNYIFSCFYWSLM